jgi:sialic acid synthase SpsE
MHDENPALAHAILEKNITTFVSVPENFDTGRIKVHQHAIYLYCIPKYPTQLDETHLPDFKKSIFKGISDHTLGVSFALYAAAHGAKYLEKHFTLAHSLQKETEKAHLCAMSMQELALIKTTTSEFGIIEKSLHKNLSD